MTGTVRRGLALVAIAGLLVSCSAPGASGGGNGQVSATLKEWQISLSPTTLIAGKITFNITNDGDKEHEFIVRKTDLQADSLPVNAAGEIVEDAPQLTEVGNPSEVAVVPPGSSGLSLTVTLQPGHYVIFCNINLDQLLHYQKGMRADFTVS